MAIVGERYFDGCLAAPTIGDVDGDGQPEIVLGTVYAGLVVYDLPGAVMGSAPWPTGRHDYARTGWADYVSYIAGLDTVQVLSPNGGEKLDGGSSHNITWTSTGTIANVNIDYSTNSGGSWTSVVAGTANDGSYAWTVPNAFDDLPGAGERHRRRSERQQQRGVHHRGSGRDRFRADHAHGPGHGIDRYQL